MPIKLEQSGSKRNLSERCEVFASESQGVFPDPGRLEMGESGNASVVILTRLRQTEPGTRV